MKREMTDLQGGKGSTEGIAQRPVTREPINLCARKGGEKRQRSGEGAGGGGGGYRSV